MNEAIRSASADESGLLQKARAHFAAGRYRDASDLFKELVNQSDEPEYRRQLAQCYLRWALSQAEEGRLKEACSSWENYAGWAEMPLAAQDSYVLWLLAVEEFSKACSAIDGLSARQLDQDYPVLATLLGFLLLAGRTEVAKHLPQSSALLGHWHAVQDALGAYRNGDAVGCGQALAKLPFRSAFRDFRNLLKAQLLAESSPDLSQALLSKIPVASPYRPAADAASAYLKTGAEFVAAMSRLDFVQRRTVAQARALAANRMDFVEAVSELGGWDSEKARFDLALRFRSLFGAEAAQAFCLGMLEHHPAGFQDYLNYFGIKDAFEESRIRALLCEKGKNSGEARAHWRQCIALLKADSPEDCRKMASLLRHMADNAARDEAAELRAESLEYDPDHRGSYLGILAYYDRDKPNPAKYEHWLERGLRRFPADTCLLGAAAQSAARRKSFAQALVYAKALLEIDPADRQARQLLFRDHLAQARRLLRAGKFELAEQEIQAAGEFAADKDECAQAELLGGFCEWMAHDGRQGLQRIADALAKRHEDPLNRQFQVGIEAALLHRSCPVSLPIREQAVTARQLVRLLASIADYSEQVADPFLLPKALDAIKAPLGAALTRFGADEALLLSWCEALENIGHFELLKHCVDGVGQKGSRPIWLYYRTLADCRGDAGRLDHMRLFELQNAMAKARALNDSKAVLLIGRLIEQSQAASNPFAYHEEDAGSDDGLQHEDVFEQLFGHVPADAMERLEQKVQDIMLETDPEFFVDQYIRRYARIIDPERLSLLFANPDFFASVSLLAAAEALQIDVGRSFEDIAERFEQALQ